MHTALFYENNRDGSVTCFLCRHRCRIVPGARGICHVRENRDGTLVSLVYGMLVAEQIDPVEKKPLFHVLPGSRTYSIATVGCNFHCHHCQNHSISQFVPGAGENAPGQRTEPQQIVRRAVQTGCRSISYTYTEPTIFAEYALDVALAASAAGLKNIFVTNGYITPEALDILAPYLTAANIDLKGYSADFYSRVAGARLEQVLECIRDYHRRGIWLEITTLVIPGENDSNEQLEGMASFIANELGPQVPWHISRFFPRHRMNNHETTPADSLARAVEAGERAGLQHLYVGNLPGQRESTFCPACSAPVIRRSGFSILATDCEHGICGQCGYAIAGCW